MKALIVDDSEINIKVAKRMLEKLNVEVDYVFSGKECLTKCNTNKYDCIFMDIMMPEMDGITTFKELQKMPNFAIPVITLTADVDNNAEERYLKEGFYDYISKPINLNKLESVITKINENKSK